MSEEKLYVYGVTDESRGGVSVEGVDGATEIRSVDYRSLSAIVSDIGTLEPDVSEGNRRAHDEVLQAVAVGEDENGTDGGRTVVPMPFGRVFEGERPLKDELRNGRGAFRSALLSVDGCVEVGVKVVAPGDESVDEAAVREAVDDELDSLAQGATAAERRGDRLVCDRSYLVAREDREAFDRAVDRLRDRVEDLTVRYDGPRAPYSFVDVELGVASRAMRERLTGTSEAIR